MIGRVGLGTLSAGLALLLGCSSGQKDPRQVGPLTAEQDGRRAFQEMIRAMDNTLLEINELERMGGGLRDRVVLIEGPSLVTDDNRLHYIEALNRSTGRIQTLRASLQTNEIIQDVLTRSDHRLNEVIAIDAKPQGAVVVYYDLKTAY